MEPYEETSPPTEPAVAVCEVYPGDITRGTVVGYRDRNTARVRIDYIMESPRPISLEMKEQIATSQIIADLPIRETSMLQEYHKGIKKYVKAGEENYFEVLEVDSNGGVVLSMKAYLHKDYVRLIQAWAEKDEYSPNPDNVPFNATGAEAMEEAERLAREEFDRRVTGYYDVFDYWPDKNDY
jgi:predicted RNA-binding protein with RPS1 domain